MLGLHPCSSSCKLHCKHHLVRPAAQLCQLSACSGGFRAARILHNTTSPLIPTSRRYCIPPGNPAVVSREVGITSREARAGGLEDSGGCFCRSGGFPEALPALEDSSVNNNDDLLFWRIRCALKYGDQHTYAHTQAQFEGGMFIFDPDVGAVERFHSSPPLSVCICSCSFKDLLEDMSAHEYMIPTTSGTVSLSSTGYKRFSSTAGAR